MDINESGLYDAELNFRTKFPDMKIVLVLSPVQNKHVMRRIFEEEKSQVVFHAAAYKHVPMMELHPWQVVFNNILGAQNILNQCFRTGVDRFVLVSTDKAVRPTNVMGASKRVCELLTNAYATELGARNMSVRFGNVIYSVGSVVPLFRKQIERGGPVTLTHRDVIRYFMTIPRLPSLSFRRGGSVTGGKIREELKRIVPEYQAQGAESMAQRAERRADEQSAKRKMRGRRVQRAQRKNKKRCDFCVSVVWCDMCEWGKV